MLKGKSCVFAVFYVQDSDYNNNNVYCFRKKVILGIFGEYFLYQFSIFYIWVSIKAILSKPDQIKPESKPKPDYIDKLINVTVKLLHYHTKKFILNIILILNDLLIKES